VHACIHAVSVQPPLPHCRGAPCSLHQRASLTEVLLLTPQVSSAARTAACRMPTAAEAAALTNFVTVVDFQLSLPPLEDDFAAPASPSGNGCASSSAAMAMAALPGSGFGPAFSPVFSPALGDGAFSSDSLPGGACQLADSGASAPASACTPPQPSGESAADFLALVRTQYYPFLSRK